MWRMFTWGEQGFTKDGDYLGRAEFYEGLRIFTWRKSRVLQRVADFYLGRAEFYKGWRIFPWAEQSFTKGGAGFNLKTQNFCLKEHVLGNEAKKFL